VDTVESELRSKSKCLAKQGFTRIRQKSEIFATFSQEKAFASVLHIFLILTVGGFIDTLKAAATAAFHIHHTRIIPQLYYRRAREDMQHPLPLGEVPPPAAERGYALSVSLCSPAPPEGERVGWVNRTE